MSDVMEKFIEIVSSIYIYIVSASIIITLLAFASDPIIDLSKDKTYITSNGVQQWEDNELYGRDILMMLINTDEMSPFPKAIRINDSPILKLDNSYIAYKMRNVGVVYSATGDYKLSTMLDYKVTDIKYVYYEGVGNEDDYPYIQYTLEEVTDE